MHFTFAPILIAAAALAVLVIFRMRQKGSTQDWMTADGFVADENNQTSVSVKGWSQPELDEILTYFLGSYELSGKMSVKVTAKSNGVLTIAFPSDIPPTILLYLVNYLKYPKDFDLTQRSIGVLGRVALTSVFNLPDPKLVGKRAEIYVPADDDQYDLVYAKTETGAAYKVPFTNLIWKAVDTARTPPENVGL
jgi:hypothetical protein